MMRTIEYIGIRPEQARARTHRGWWVLVAALAVATACSWPLIPFVRAQQNKASNENADAAITLLEKGSPGERLAAAALQRAKSEVKYDPSYYLIDYPGGDIPADRGIAADMVVRSFRAVGIDLQKKVHEDMSAHFRDYPQFWKMKKPDANIDHRRVPNLQRYFSRKGNTLPVSRDAKDYEFGDLVVWRLPYGSFVHIGVVVPGPGSHAGEKWVVHNVGSGTVWEDALFSYEITGHYSYGK